MAAIVAVFLTLLPFAIYMAWRRYGPSSGEPSSGMVVALLLGVVFLAEPLTLGMLVGLPLVAIGSYLASRRRDAYVRKSKRSPLHLQKSEEIPETL